jgi:hypothetical protein
MTLPALIPLSRCKEMIGPSESTIRREVEAGRLKLVKVRGASFICGASAAAWRDALPTAGAPKAPSARAA